MTWCLTFGGQEAQHSNFTYSFLDRVFLEQKIEQIIELGTGNGVLSMYFGLWGIRLKIPVYTVDIGHFQDRDRTIMENMLSKLSVIKITCDIFTTENIKRISKLLQEKTSFLLCDNGNKIKEFQTFAPVLKKGSIISAHDWGTEIPFESVKEVISKEKLLPLYEDSWKNNDELLMSIWIKS